MQAGIWFNAEGEQRLKNSYTTNESLMGTEEALQHFDVFHAESKVLQQYNNILKNCLYLAVYVSFYIPKVFLSFFLSKNCNYFTVNIKGLP